MKAFLILFAVGAITMLAAEPWVLPSNQPKFRSGPGAEVATANCLLCHSADYVSTQPPLNRAQWLAIVTKMREKYGAPMPTNQVERVVEYLSANYGSARKP